MISLRFVSGTEAEVKVEVELGVRAFVGDGETGRDGGSVEVFGSVQCDATGVRHFAARILRAPEYARYAKKKQNY